MGYTPYIDFFVKADKKGIIRGKKIFLQHGIIKDNLTYLYNTKDVYKRQVIDLMTEVNEPLSFSECGIDEETYMRNVPDIANKAFEDQCTTANPKLPLVKEIEQIMIDAYKGVN